MHSVRSTLDQCCALVGRHRCHGAPAALRGLDRTHHVRETAVRRGIDQLAGGLIADRIDTTVGRIDPFTVYQHPHGATPVHK
jgi:hypothetical protein